MGSEMCIRDSDGALFLLSLQNADPASFCDLVVAQIKLLQGSKQTKFVTKGRILGVFRDIWRAFLEILPLHKSKEKRRIT